MVFPKNPAERITIISIFTTTSLGAIEVVAGLVLGSIAFTAAGVDAITDTATSIGVIAGLRISKRPADKGHPYGHYQAETLASVALAILLVFAGIRIAYSAMERLYVDTPLKAAAEVTLLAILSALILGMLARFKIRTGKQSGNMSVVADGYHTLTDTISAAAVSLGAVLVWFGYPQADPIVALGISILITRWGLGIGRDALGILMEASPGSATVVKIKKVCREVPGVVDCHRCRARRVGSRIFADLHVLVDQKLSIKEAHEVATRVEQSLKTKISELNSVVVHIEPAKGIKSGKKR